MGRGRVGRGGAGRGGVGRAGQGGVGWGGVGQGRVGWGGARRGEMGGGIERVRAQAARLLGVGCSKAGGRTRKSAHEEDRDEAMVLSVLHEIRAM